MKRFCPYILAASLLLSAGCVMGQQANDSLDVLHYDIQLDMGHAVEGTVVGNTEIRFVLTRDCDGVDFDLVCDTLRPVSLDGTVTRGFSYDRSSQSLRVNIDGGRAGDTHTVVVPYSTHGYVEGYGWGGLHLKSNLYYNLGVAFEEYPHCFGRAWFACRDNFYDKATYTLTVTSRPGWRALCGGVKASETAHPDGSNTSVWQMEHPAPTYLVSVSSAPWHIIEREYQGIYGTYPATLGYLTQDSATVSNTYDILEAVVPAFEQHFGPYRWGRIGYIATPKGSMEHINNIGLISSCMASSDVQCHRVICHELSHAWFGNLITCASAADMWINEGGASFSEEVAVESMQGREAAEDAYQQNLSMVLRRAHIDDGGFLPLSGMPEEVTYGTTTYNKGALVWHDLRGLMGDSLFMACMHRLFDRCAFGNLDAATLRDSLSLYSGMDLTGFFDFHVFHPGFVDYAVEQMTVENCRATVTLRQLLRGTEHYAQGCRIPLTFLSPNKEECERWMTVGDSIATETFVLPFSPTAVVVDLHHKISDACLDDTAVLSKARTLTLANSFCKIAVKKSSSDPTAWLHVCMHFAHPHGQMPVGVTRMSDRYWRIVGNVPQEAEVQGQFMYNLGPAGGSEVAYLDSPFYNSSNARDSLCLLYRYDASQPWQAISHERTRSSTLINGYLVAPRLRVGEYALGIADTNVTAINATDNGNRAETFTVKPNPGNSEFTIDMHGYDKKFDLAIFDLSGRKVLQMNDVGDGVHVSHHLMPGSYIAIIKNNFISLQSQILIQ